MIAPGARVATRLSAMSKVFQELARGLGYVPGIARGPIRREVHADAILLADHETLRSLTTWPAGCILTKAAPFSHASIALLSRGIPTVILDADQSHRLVEGTAAVLDGAAGRVLPASIHPDALTPEPPPVPRSLQTRDGKPVALRVSVRTADAARRARERGAAAVGLVRSEFLLPADDRVPDKDFYLQAFEDILAAAAPLSVTIRLLDLAPDKHPAWAAALPKTGALGRHGSRLYDEPLVRSVLDVQLAALAELCPRYPVRVLIPNLATVAALAHWRRVVSAAMRPCDPVVGPMLETAGAALMVDRFLAESALVGIGLNDLMQSLYGADRDVPQVSDALDPYAPGVYRFLAQVARIAGTDVERVQLCGILPQLPGVLPVLLGLGYRTFSVDVAHVHYLARTVATRTCAQDRALAEAVTAAGSAREVKGVLGLAADH
jgi:phosphoenolpyruvate-protein kinase (PTS system EI component)